MDSRRYDGNSLQKEFSGESILRRVSMLGVLAYHWVVHRQLSIVKLASFISKIHCKIWSYQTLTKDS